MTNTSSKPLFNAEFVAFSPFDVAALGQLLTINRPSLALELGCWLGNGSTQVFLGNTSHTICVDHFRGNSNVARHQAITSDYDVFGTFLRNTAEYRNKLSVLQMDSDSASAIIADGSLDFIFIDGDHSYHQTQLDMRNFLPKVRRGGIFAGHDCEGRVTQFSAETLAGSERLDTLSLPGYKFSVIHPGCIRAVSEKFGDKAQLFADQLIDDGTGRLGYSSIWYVHC
jgi:hypothetical protein